MPLIELVIYLGCLLGLAAWDVMQHRRHAEALRKINLEIVDLRQRVRRGR